MRAIAFVFVTGALGAAIIAGLAGGCGGDEAATEATDSGADTTAVPPIPALTSNGTGTSTGGVPPTTSGGLPGSPDGGDEGAPPPGVVSNPGRITCGDTECDAGGGEASGVCCLYDGGASPACARFFCPRGGGSGDVVDEACDETADCPTGGGGRQLKCCFEQGSVSCDDRCARNGNGVQVCKTDAECGDAGPCNPKTCRGVTLRVCGAPDGCQ